MSPRRAGLRALPDEGAAPPGSAPYKLQSSATLILLRPREAREKKSAPGRIGVVLWNSFQKRYFTRGSRTLLEAQAAGRGRTCTLTLSRPGRPKALAQGLRRGTHAQIPLPTHPSDRPAPSAFPLCLPAKFRPSFAFYSHWCAWARHRRRRPKLRRTPFSGDGSPALMAAPRLVC